MFLIDKQNLKRSTCQRAFVLKLPAKFDNHLFIATTKFAVTSFSSQEINEKVPKNEMIS